MPTVLILSLSGTSFFSTPHYPTLLPALLSRTTVHESISASDCLPYLSSNWPSVVLVTDPVPTFRQHRPLLLSLRAWLRNGGTLILAGSFAAHVDWPDLNATLQLLQADSGLPWCMGAYSKERAKLRRTVRGLRTHSLDQHDVVQGIYLRRVPSGETVYAARHMATGSRKGGAERLACAAYAQVGFGWLGFLGDMNFSANAERVVLAMCRLDEPVVNGNGVSESTAAVGLGLEVPRLLRRKSNPGPGWNPWTRKASGPALKESRSVSSLGKKAARVEERRRSSSETSRSGERFSDELLEPEPVRREFLVGKRHKGHKNISREMLGSNLVSPNTSPRRGRRKFVG